MQQGNQTPKGSMLGGSKRAGQASLQKPFDAVLTRIFRHLPAAWVSSISFSILLPAVVWAETERQPESGYLR